MKTDWGHAQELWAPVLYSLSPAQWVVNAALLTSQDSCEALMVSRQVLCKL